MSGWGKIFLTKMTENAGLMTMTRLSGYAAQAAEGVRQAIGTAAARTGVDFSYLMAQARSESGLDPAAKAANSSAGGLFQFLDQSWLAVVKRHGGDHGLDWAASAIQARPGGGFTVDPSMREAVFGLREQAGPAALMAASYASDNAQGLGQALGREAGATDLYFAHFLGLGGATRFLRAAARTPDAAAAGLFPREAAANRSIFYAGDGSARSLDEVYALMGRRLAAAGANDGAAAPGSLVDTPPGPGTATLRMASLDGTSDTSDSATSGDDVSAMMEALQRGRLDMLRPTPAQAKLAYLMLSAAPLA